MLVGNFIKEIILETKVILQDIYNDTVYYNDYVFTKKGYVKNAFKKYLDKTIEILYAYDRNVIKIFIKGETKYGKGWFSRQ